jgi:hypothetical protein
MLDVFFIDSLFVMFGGRMFQQTIGIPMGMNCAPPLADLFLYAIDADFFQGLLKNKHRKLAQNFDSSFRYIDDVLSLNILDSVIICMASIQMSSKQSILLPVKSLLLFLTFILKSTMEED